MASPCKEKVETVPDVLEVKDICKSFDGLQVLNKVSFSVKRGEIVGLIGPNGAGKTTLLNIITSIYKPDRGKVYLQNRDITGLSPHKVTRLGIARTFQIPRPFLNLTVMENLLISSLYRRKELDEVEEEAARSHSAFDILELVGLIDKKNLSVWQTNMSERRLLEVAMALCCNPVVLLLDEPMAGLTTHEMERLASVITRIRDERATSILWVEHRVDAVFSLCDRIVVLNFGFKIAEGEPEEVRKDHRVVEAYLGEEMGA